MTESETLFDQYVQRMKNNSSREFGKRYNEDLSNEKKTLALIEEIPEFLEIFNKSDFSVQKRILKMMKNGKCTMNSFMHLKLLHDTGLDYHKVNNWEILDSHSKYSPSRNKNTVGSTELSDSIHNFFRCIAGVRFSALFYTPPKINSRTLLMLTFKYDEERVIEAMKRWIDLKPENSFYDFIQLVEDWDNLKEYPLEWSLKVISTHQCEDVGA